MITQEQNKRLRDLLDANLKACDYFHSCWQRSANAHNDLRMPLSMLGESNINLNKMEEEFNSFLDSITVSEPVSLSAEESQQPPQ